MVFGSSLRVSATSLADLGGMLTASDRREKSGLSSCGSKLCRKVGGSAVYHRVTENAGQEAAVQSRRYQSGWSLPTITLLGLVLIAIPADACRRVSRTDRG
jgi:hypothetical protein